ncbi:MAG: hypothetical protein SFY67_16255 [Candidatus Melainabacteria bacterium]|nr:hypothetical protein [Candidatus Melainabacteria bacterium]
MKPDKIHDELAIIKDHLTLQKLAKHNTPLFAISMVSLAASIALFTVAILASVVHNLSSFFTFLAFAFICAGACVITSTLLFFGPKGVLAKRYSKQLEQQDLHKLSEEELHTLIDFHRNLKNFEAADQVSKHLMLKVEAEED